MNRSYLPSASELDREERLVNTPHWQSEAGPLRDLLRRIRAARDDQQLFDVQISLLSRLRARQELIGEVRNEIARTRDRRRALADQTPKRTDELRAAQQTIDRLERELAMHRALHRVVLVAGDALAWRRLRYDRAAITALGHGPLVGWLSDGRGWEAEGTAVQAVWDEGVLALVNDGTTCLRHGDITCFFPDRIEVREVKAGAAADPDGPQMRRLATVVDLINTKRGTVDGNEGVIVHAARPYRTHLAHAEPLLRKAAQRRIAINRVSPAQLVVARSLQAPSGAPPFDDGDARRAANWKDDDVVLHWGTTLRRMRDRHESYAFLAPLSILPAPVDLVVEVMLGSLDMTTFVNVSCVARDLVARGFATATPIRPPESGDAFLRVGVLRGNVLHELQLAPHVREVMALELMTPAALAELVHASLRGARLEAGVTDARALAVPVGEVRVWEG